MRRTAAALLLLAALPVTAIVGLVGFTLFDAMLVGSGRAAGIAGFIGIVLLCTVPAVLFLLVRTAVRLDRSARAARSLSPTL